MEDNNPRPWKLARSDVPGPEDMEAGPSVIMEELVVGNRRSGYTQPKQSVFLSHSGVQKAFARRLRNALERNAYFPFFDEDPDALPKGEPFARLIKSACRRADVAVVVLSDEFLTSKWPMIELAIFVKEQMRRSSSPDCQELKILPLFMGFSVEEFREIDRQTSWQNKWNEMGVKDNRIDASEWEEALKVLGSTNGLEYCRFKNEEEYIESIVSAILKLVPPDLRWGDTHMKGKSKFHEAVSEMFARSPSRTRFHKVRAIGLYGMGGIGKTTLCKSLCNRYFAEFDGKVWHVELGKKSAELVQKDVLRHLVGISESLLNYSVKCKDQWQGLMQRDMEYKVFLAIDNVWNEDVSREQVEALLKMSFHPESLVIVTSRSRGLLEWLGIDKDCCFEMPMLDKDDATEILLESAAPGCHMDSLADHQQAAVEKVVERCFMTKGPISCAESAKQYIPLALEVLGRQLRLPLFGGPAELADWANSLDLKRSDEEQHPLFSVLGYSYDKLPSSKHKSIFLDVALCVPRQEDNTSASVSEVCKWLSMVYDCDVGAILRVNLADVGFTEFKGRWLRKWLQLQGLQRHGLVEKWQGPASLVGMHELYYEFAKVEVGKVAHLDEQDYLYDEDGRRMPALMRWFPGRNHLPLRRIHVYTGGFTKLSSREFRFMANVEVLKLDFCFELKSLDVRCLESLRSVELRGCFSLEEVTGLSDLSGLSFFRWNTCRLKPEYAMPDFPEGLKVVEIYGSKDSIMRTMGSFGECIGVLELTLRRHPLLEAVPDLCNLEELQKVDFSGCCSVEAVQGLVGLRQLRHLNLENCKRLGSCAGLETLVEIETLNLGGCVGIQLPGVWDLSLLMKLRCINIRGILVVDKLVLGSSQLEQLNVMGCSDLRTVALVSTDSASWKFLDRLNEQRRGDPGEAWQWTVECGSVVERNSFDDHECVNLSNCRTLESLGGIGSLSSLKFLYLRNCSILKTLPNLSHAPCLEVVDFSNCCKLADLGDIGPLRALQYLYLRKCGSLRCLRDLCSPCLKVLDLSGCSAVEGLGSFDSLSALQMLILSECVSLEALPSLRKCSVLEVLDVSGCTKLRAVSKMTTRKVVIDISGCWSLESIPILSDLSKLELDVTVGDEVEDAANKALNSGDVLSLKLTCHVGNSTCQTPEELESWEDDLMDVLRSDEVDERQILLECRLVEMLWPDDTKALSQESKMELFVDIMMEIRRLKEVAMLWYCNMNPHFAENDMDILLQVEGALESLRSFDAKTWKQGIRSIQEILAVEDPIMCNKVFGGFYAGIPACINLLEAKRLKSTERVMQCEGIALTLSFAESSERTRRIEGIVEWLQGPEDAETRKREIKSILGTLDVYDNAEEHKRGILGMLGLIDALADRQGKSDIEGLKRFIERRIEILVLENAEAQKRGILEVIGLGDALADPQKQSGTNARAKRIIMEAWSRESDFGVHMPRVLKRFLSGNPAIREEDPCLLVSAIECDRSIYRRSSQDFEERFSCRRHEVSQNVLQIHSSEIRQLANIAQASEEERGFFPVWLFKDDVDHFRNIKTLLEFAYWEQWQLVIPQLIQVKFSSVSVSSESLTAFPSSSFFSTVSRLELVRCRRLQRLSHLNGLLALETLVIAHCDELENLPDLGKSAALKHLTIRDFRRGPRFQFLSYLCQPVQAYPDKWAPCDLRSLVELNLDNCVGLGGLEHWGPLPALESLVIKDCNTVIQLPDLRRSSKLSKVIVMNCEHFITETVHVGSEEALRFARMEGCGNQMPRSYLSRGELCEALRMHSLPYGYSLVGVGLTELINWLERGDGGYSCMDMFSGVDFSQFMFTSQAKLETLNGLLVQWHSSILK